MKNKEGTSFYLSVDYEKNIYINICKYIDTNILFSNFIIKCLKKNPYEKKYASSTIPILIFLP